MKDLIERALSFEISDELGNGDFALMRELADAIWMLRAENEQLVRAIADHVTARGEYMQQRDELCIALKNIQRKYGTERDEWDAVERVIPEIMQIAADAITSVKGGA